MGSVKTYKVIKIFFLNKNPGDIKKERLSINLIMI